MGLEILKSVFTSALVVVGAVPAFAQQQPTGSWAVETGGTNFSSPYGGSASDGTYMYIFGGYQYGATFSYPGYYATTRRYDPASNQWTTLAQMPYGNYYNCGAHVNGVIYSFTGYSTTYGWSQYNLAYSIANNTWTVLSATLSTPRYYHACAAMNNLIYIAGGYNPYSGPVANHEVYNPSTGQFTNLASLPGYQYNHGMAAVPALNKIYSMGGYTAQGYNGINYEYTPETNTWTSRANISNGSSQQNMLYIRPITLSNRVYVPGGQNAQTGIITSTFEYNPFSNTWTQRASMQYQRYMHAAVAINNKGYVYGGPYYPTTGEEYTPPNFGSPPNAPTNLLQTGSRVETSMQADTDPNQLSGWTNNQITFSADLTDPDAGQQVRWRVQVKRDSASWTQANQVTTLQTNFAPQGPHTLSFSIPADGGYDWRWRVEDAFGNSHPIEPTGWIEAFGSAAVPNTHSPDFRSDQVSPSDPTAVAPHDTDIQVGDPTTGPVTLYWTEATDNGPTAGIEYEIQVATDGGFINTEAQVFSPAGSTTFPVSLSVSRFDKFWRIRARDIGGNLSNWSLPKKFRVTYNDGIDHSAGDAKKACGFSASAAPALSGLMLGFLILVFGLSIRSFR